MPEVLTVRDIWNDSRYLHERRTTVSWTILPELSLSFIGHVHSYEEFWALREVASCSAH